MGRIRAITRCLTGLVCLGLFTGACQTAPTLPAPTAATAALATATPAPRTSPLPSATPTPGQQVKTVRLAESLPQALINGLQLPPGYALAAQGEAGDVRIAPTDGPALSQWVYALAAPFPTLRDELPADDLRRLWQDGAPIPGGPSELIADPATLGLFELAWGPPSAHVIAVEESALLAEAWQRPAAWALLPFEQIGPRWKVIAVDGQNPLHKDFDVTRYALTVSIGLQGTDTDVAALTACCGPASATPLLPAANRRADRLTTVVVTGVTALVRGTAALMAYHGMDYPAEKIGDWLRDADILHISNEVAFAANCPDPNNWEGLAFCSQPRMIQLLDDVGADVIDLAGDHFADWGPEAMLFTLDLYRERGWQTYGGGLNVAAARQPALFEHNGNRIAFLGCNAKAPGYATVGPNAPGAIHCDWSWLDPAIRVAAADGYQPIVTFQHEEYYEYIAREQLQVDFRAAANAGAVVVSGSQAHLPQAMAFQGDAFLHYGLGNLFFDQVFSEEGTDKAFIDRHVFYDGAYINTELLTIQFTDYAQSRPMTVDERDQLLRTIFAASGWTEDTQVK